MKSNWPDSLTESHISIRRHLSVLVIWVHLKWRWHMLMQSRVCSCSSHKSKPIEKYQKQQELSPLSAPSESFVVNVEEKILVFFIYIYIFEGSLPQFLVFLPTAEHTCKVFGSQSSGRMTCTRSASRQTSFPELVEVESGRIKVKDTSSLFWVLLTSKTTQHTHMFYKVFKNNQNNLEYGLRTVKSSAAFLEVQCVIYSLIYEFILSESNRLCHVCASWSRPVSPALWRPSDAVERASGSCASSQKNLLEWDKWFLAWRQVVCTFLWNLAEVIRSEFGSSGCRRQTRTKRGTKPRQKRVTEDVSATFGWPEYLSRGT